MTHQNMPIEPKPIIVTDAVLYLSDLDVELSDNDSVYTEICFNDDLDFDPYFAEDEDEDSDDETDAKIYPSEK